MSYASHLGPGPVSEALPGQIPNSTGGHAFPVDDWTRLDRFLILGSEGGSYYATERALTIENSGAVQRCLVLDGVRTVDRIVEISNSGRAPKNEPALMALALAAKHGDPVTRSLALKLLPEVARIGTHLFHFADYVERLGGWGRGTRRAFADWYLKRPEAGLALQAIKYQQRDGWSHRDILRKAHPQPSHASPTTQAILNWMVKGWPSVGSDPHKGHPALGMIWAYESARTADEKTLVKLITDYQLPHECVPDAHKGSAKVWDAMLPHMGMTALIRNLGKLSSVGLLKPLSKTTKSIVARLTSAEELKRARIHPLQVLVALNTYGRGKGVKGSLTWEPNRAVSTALDQAFYLAFKAVEPTGKRHLLALDVSGSMNCNEVAGMTGISPRVGSAAMAMITAAAEDQTHFVGFSSGLVQLAIGRGHTLSQVVEYIDGFPYSATDCSLPILWALKNRIEVDAFVTYTDSETNCGIHPSVALDAYRQKMGIAAKAIVVGMVSNGFTIADPKDAGQLDVVGFDTAAPAVMANFIRG